MDKIWSFFVDNWVAITAIVVWINQGRHMLAPLTKNTIDDNIATIFGKLIAKFFQKGQ